MKFIFYAFRVTIGIYTVLNRSNWTSISTCFNMELVVTSTKTCKNVSTKTCKNVSMSNISNIRNISFVSKYKLKLSICPKFLTFDLTYIQNISVKRIRYGFSTSFYDRNYLPISYSNIIISKTHLNPTKPSTHAK